MGLDTSHDAWHGAYSAFMRWREKIAEVAGFPPLMIMEGFYDGRGPGGVGDMKAEFLPTTGEWEKDLLIRTYFRRGALPLQWADQKGDKRLLPLLTHSDCDGEMSPDECRVTADALEELLPKLPDGNAGGHIGIWKEKTLQFIAGCRAAAEAKEPLGFH